MLVLTAIRRLAVVGFAAIVMGCGGGQAEGIQVSSPFGEREAKYFEDGIDFIADPATMDGRWKEEWAGDMDARIELSDFIARVSVASVRSHWDLDRTMMQLELKLEARLHGVPPSDPITVTVHDGDPGYASVKSIESRVLNTTHVLFVKWYETEEGEIRAHWHMAPDSDQVLATVTTRLELLHGSTAQP